ncbi:MAG: hypothetical protein WBC22_09665 [Sedimentisphaerales bacterium]
MKKLMYLISLFLIFLLISPAMGLELVRQKNVATIICFPLVDGAGDPVINEDDAGLDSETDNWSDGAGANGFIDCTNEGVESEDGVSGWYNLSLTQAEMNFDYIAIVVKTTTAGVIDQRILIRTQVGDPLNVATSDDGSTINVTGGAVDTVTTTGTASSVAALANNVITAASIADNAIAGEHLNATAVTKIIDDFETQSQADPTGFHVNVKEVNGTAQTANDNSADINTLITQVGTAGNGLTNIDLPNQTMDISGTITTATNVGTVNGLASNVITAASINDGAIGAAEIANAAIDNATFAADVGTTAHGSNHIALAARKILEELNLDHLLKVTTGVAADSDLEDYVVAGTVMAHALSVSADATTFKPSTDSLEAIRNNQAGADVAAIADAVWDELATGHTDAGKAGQQLWTDMDAILTDTAVIGALGVGLTAITDDTSQIGLAGVGLTEAGGDGDHLAEAGGTGDQLTAIDLPNQTMDITGTLSTVTTATTATTCGTVNALAADSITASALKADAVTEIIDNFETQSAADPTGFKVNVMEVNGTSQTANDMSGDVNDILVDTNSTLDTLVKDIPTTAEFALRSLLAADYTIVADLGTVQSGDSVAIVNGEHGLVSIQDDVDDIPNTAEFALRSLLAADYTIVADLGTVQTGDSFARIGAAGVSLTEAGGTGDQLTAIDLPNQTMDITGTLSTVTTATTATNLTNAPTVGDFTATMKTSLDTAADTVTVTSIGADVITATSIQANAITNDKVANDVLVDVNTIEGGDATDALDTAADTVTVTSIGANAITATSIQANAITNDKVANDVQVDIVSISTSTDAADKLEASAETIVTAAASAGTLSATQMTTTLTETTNDHYNGRIIIWTSGVLIGQATDITDYDGATKLLTYTGVTEAPTAGDTFNII